MNRAILILPAMMSLAAPVLAQTPPASGARTASDLTRDLNSAPPTATPPSQTRPKETPAKPPAVPVVEPSPQTDAEIDPEPEAAATSSRDEEADGAVEGVVTDPQTSGAPVEDLAADDLSDDTADDDAQDEGMPAAVDETPPPAPEPEPLSAAERAALPFTLDLPVGFALFQRPAGPRAAVYAVRGEGRTYVMIYAGPASQFPIYDGQRAQVAGRTSVVVTESGRRRAVEHLFQREAEPREIHVWLASVDDDQAALAEQIAQTVDPR